MAIRFALCCLFAAAGCGEPVSDPPADGAGGGAMAEADPSVYSWNTPTEFNRMFRDTRTPPAGPTFKPDAEPFAKVVEARTGRPVGRATVDMILIGPDGGDGGFYKYTTEPDGTVRGDHRLTPGRYQWAVTPDPTLGLRRADWRRGDEYVVVSEDGVAEPMTFRLPDAAG